MEGYNEWMRYIYQQNELSSAKEAHCYVIVVNFVNADRVADAKVMNLLLEEANEIINPNK